MRAFGKRGLPDHLPPEELARIAFAIDNIPKDPTGVSETFPYGSFAPRYITGSVDAITCVTPGVSLLEYNGGPWPEITTLDDTETLDWLERVVTLIKLDDRPPGEHYELDVSDPACVQRFADASYAIWDAVKKHDTRELAEAVNESYNAWVKVCLRYADNGGTEAVESLWRQGIGAFIQGAGYGGYIACVSEQPSDRISIQVRRATPNSYNGKI